MKILLKYSSYFAVFAASLFLSYVIQTNDFFKGFLALPAAGSLIMFLYEAYRDNRMHERSLEIQNRDQDYVLATASHMADVAYDKHVLFCEEYIHRVQSGLQELFRDGPTYKALDFGRELVNIRQRHASWLTKEIEAKLKPFEEALIEIGAKEGLIDRLPAGEQRTAAVEKVYKTFGLILEFERYENEREESIAISNIIEYIRGILGITILTELRQKVSKTALARLNID